MMKTKKGLIALVLLLCGFVCLAMPHTVQADNGIMPLNLYTRLLNITGGIDVVTGVLTADITVSTTEKCEIYTTMDIYRIENNDLVFYKSFRNPRSGVYTGQKKSYEDTCKVEKGYDYYIVATAYVTSVEDGISEVVTNSTGYLSYK